MMIRLNSFCLLLSLLLTAALLSATPGFYDSIRLDTPIPELAIYDLLRYRETEAATYADSLETSKQIVRICFAHRKHDLARHYLGRLPEFEKEPGKANALLIFSHIKGRQYRMARAVALDFPEAQAAKAFSQMYLGDFKAAKESLAKSKNQEQHLWILQSEHPAKKAWLAGTLAVVPGLGYAYNGMYQTALSAFLMNAAIMATVWELSDNGLPIAAFSLGLAGSSFYLGNIWGSANAANKINLERRERSSEIFLNSYIYDLLGH